RAETRSGGARATPRGPRARARRARTSRSGSAKRTASRANRRDAGRSTVRGGDPAGSDRKNLLGAIDQLLRIERLADEAGRAALFGFGGRALVDLAAEHDHRDRAVCLLDPLQHLPAVRAG